MTGKVGYYAISLKSADKQSTAELLCYVADPDAPTVGAYFGTTWSKLKKKVIGGDTSAEQNQELELMVGATAEFPLTVSEGASVKASGHPAGLKLAQNKTTKRWTITGYPTKAGTFLSSGTVTKNGVSSVKTFTFKVLANAASVMRPKYLI